MDGKKSKLKEAVEVVGNILLSLFILAFFAGVIHLIVIGKKLHTNIPTWLQVMIYIPLGIFLLYKSITGKGKRWG